ncbi:MAG: 50S ribosomal protein L21 [Peptococcaceae bacterium]|nr:50S ribosomal protein L21 [Peptococcaceae bacterium]
MYAVLETGGKQYTVRQGDVIQVEKLAADEGESLELDHVLLIGGDSIQVGTPFVPGAKVVAKVLEHGKNKKVISFRYKPKKHVRVKKGHRQPYTELSIESIVG